MSYHPEMQLNVNVGKERSNGLSLRTEPFCSVEDAGFYQEPERKPEQEPNQVLKHKHLSSSKSHISVNNTKQAISLPSIPSMAQ